MEKILRLGLVLAIIGLLAAPALCAEKEAAGKAAEATEKVSWPMAVAVIGTCLGAGLVAIGGGLGIARIGAACIEATARQPEAAGAMFAPMIITAAMVEGGMLFAIVVCLLGVLGI